MLRCANMKAWSVALMTLGALLNVNAADAGKLKLFPETNRWFGGDGTCDSGVCDTSPVCSPLCCDDVFAAPGSWCDQLRVEVEATFLTPEINGGNSFAEIPLGAINSGAVAPEDFYAAPRLSIGYGLGETPFFAQVRYWRLDVFEDQAFSPLAISSAGLDMQTFDFELGRSLCLPKLGSEMTVTFGGRYVDVDTFNALSISGFDGPNGLSASALSSSEADYNGAGLTFSVQGKRQIRCSPWHLFGGFRGSWIFGESDASAFTQATSIDINAGPGAPPAGGFAVSANSASADGVDETVFIAEFQAGTQYERELKCVDANAFFRVAFEYQIWQDADLQAGSGSFASVSTVGLSRAQAIAGPLDIDLYGVSVSAGINW